MAGLREEREPGVRWAGSRPHRSRWPHEYSDLCPTMKPLEDSKGSTGVIWLGVCF